MRGHHDNPIRSRPVMRSRQISPSKNRAVRNPNRAAWLWTIGNSLKAEYDAVATPLPSSLAALVEQLEMQKEERKIAAYSFHRPARRLLRAPQGTTPPPSEPKNIAASVSDSEERSWSHPGARSQRHLSGQDISRHVRGETGRGECCVASRRERRFSSSAISRSWMVTMRSTRSRSRSKSVR
jgi:hypothetical protein